MTEPDAVASRADLAAFVHTMAEEIQAGSDRWENDNLGSYLDALSAWMADMDGWFRNRGEQIPDQPDWRLVANMLRAATPTSSA